MRLPAHLLDLRNPTYKLLSLSSVILQLAAAPETLPQGWGKATAVRPSLCLAGHRRASGVQGRWEEAGHTGPGKQRRLPSRQDGIRFHSAESSSQVYKSQPPPPLLSVFFPPHFYCFVFLAAEIPPPCFSLSPFLPPSFP